MNLIVDNNCEIEKLLLPWTRFQYHSVENLEIDPSALYVVGREQCRVFPDKIREMVNRAEVVFSNPAEGSETFVGHLHNYGLNDLAASGRMKCVVGGDIGNEYTYIKYNHFLAQIFRFDENVAAAATVDKIFQTRPKPYKFLFLNGRARWHRSWLIHELEQHGVLNSALWTSLDGDRINYLPAQYEIDEFIPNINQPCDNKFVKYQLFNNIWGEIYIKPELYWDTYFSLVTETVFKYPWSFLTEKIAKPLAQGHPFIAVANAGFYADLHALGFRTFGHVIDESFDVIENPVRRLEKIRDVVVDLCQQDLDKFLEACQDVCKYNQQRLRELSKQIPHEFPARFFQLINRPYPNPV